MLDRLGIPAVQGVLFDLGVSSMQLDEAERGFAYAQDAPLDMRMDQTTGISAAEVLNTYPPGELVRILRAYGEEKFAREIVDAVVRERDKEPFTNSARLVELIRAALPQAAKRTGGNPAKRTFQALRIEVNGELARPGEGDSGRRRPRWPSAAGSPCCRTSRWRTGWSSRCSRPAPPSPRRPACRSSPSATSRGCKLLTRGAELPTEDEVAANRRAAPARLRGAERIREDVAGAGGQTRDRGRAPADAGPDAGWRAARTGGRPAPPSYCWSSRCWPAA